MKYTAIVLLCVGILIIPEIICQGQGNLKNENDPHHAQTSPSVDTNGKPHEPPQPENQVDNLVASQVSKVHKRQTAYYGGGFGGGNVGGFGGGNGGGFGGGNGGGFGGGNCYRDRDCRRYEYCRQRGRSGYCHRRRY